MVELIEYDGEFYDLCYSPDDSGWYLQRHKDDATSEIYLKDSLAIAALYNNVIEWER